MFFFYNISYFLIKSSKVLVLLNKLLKLVTREGSS